MAWSFAFDPIVLASRCISCTRKPRRLPTGSRAVRVQRLPEELEVRAEAHDLLVDVPSLRQVGDLPGQAVLVHLHLLGELPDRLRAGGPAPEPHDPGARSATMSRWVAIASRRPARSSCSRAPSASRSATRACAASSAIPTRTSDLHGRCALGVRCAEDLAEVAEHAHVDHPRDGQLLLDRLEGLLVAPGPLEVHPHAAGALRAAPVTVDGQVGADVPAGDVGAEDLGDAPARIGRSRGAS